MGNPLLRFFVSRLWLGATVLLWPSLVLIGSWNNVLISARPAAMAGAFVSVAGDPCSVYFNPAGLAGLRTSWAVDLEGFYVLPRHSYGVSGRPDAASRRDGVIPHGFAAYRLKPRLAFGFGIFLAYASSAVRWKSEDTGLPLESVLGVYSFSPAVAYRLSDFMSVGLALNIYRAGLSLTSELDPFGLIENSESGGAVSANLGIQARPFSGLDVGLTVKSPARMNTTGRTSMEIEGIPLRFPSETSFQLPWDLEAGLSYRAGGRLLIAASAELALWSSLKTLDKVFKNVPLVGDVAVSTAMNYRNILILRTGGEWSVSSALQVRAGFSWDPAAASEENLNLGNIDVDKKTVSLGCSWRAGRTQFDLTCGYAFGAQRSRRSDDMGPGTVETFDLDIFYVGLGVRFFSGTEKVRERRISRPGSF